MKPNIIIFNPDQMRADAIAHLGNRSAITPFLDKFIEDAVSFLNNFCQNTVCVPSRCSFLTGLYPHVKGHRTMSYMLQKEEPSLLRELKESGYFVWMNSRNDFLPAQVDGIFDLHTNETFYGGDIPEAADLGIENIVKKDSKTNLYCFYFGEKGLDKNGENNTIDDEAVNKAIDIIKSRKSEQPFCMFLGLQLPHPPYEIEEPYFSAINKEKLPERIKEPEQYEGKPSILKRIAKEQKLDELNEEDWDNIRSCYLGMCMKVDVLFEKLCDALKEEGIYDDTAIFFFSDHGDYTGDYGIVEKTQNTFEDCLVKVPLLIKPPKTYKVDSGISDSLTELIDVYATVMEMCDIKPKNSHFGRSLIPVLENRLTPQRTYVFSEGGRLAGELHCNETNGVEPSPYNPYYPRMVAQMDDIAHTKATMIRSSDYKYIRRLYEEDEFYDLIKDPKEIRNEINNPEYQSIIASMRLQLLEWYQETCDIVPFEEDKRFNYDMIWNRVKLLCPIDMEVEVKQKIEGGADLYQLQRWLRNVVKNRRDKKAVIFDLDGVIVHTDYYHYMAWKAVADRLQLNFDENLNNKLRGVSRMESLNIILDSNKVKLSETEKEEIAEEKNEIYKQHLMKMTPADIDSKVLNTLLKLKEKGIKIAIGSSSKNARMILERTDLINLFDAISDGNNIIYSKPHPEVFVKAAEFINQTPGDCLVVEDAIAGIDAGIAGGFETAAIGDATSYVKATYKLSEFSDLLRILAIS